MSSTKNIDRLLVLVTLALATIGFLVLCQVAGTPLPIPAKLAIFAIALAVVVMAVALGIVIVRQGVGQLQGVLPLTTLAIIVTLMALAMAYQMAHYIMLPVDLLSFAESPFINDILKFRLGTPIYTSPTENNSYPYAPGTQLLTYFLASLFGRGDSIAFLRGVQFSYVMVACIVAASLCDSLSRKFVAGGEYRHRPLWIAVWLPCLFLLATEPRFNEYTHSLHNDGLSLLLSVCAFWLMVKHSAGPRSWMVVCMTILPALGFMVKQSQLAWGGIFFIYLLLSEKASWRQLVYYSLCSTALVAATLGVCYLLWGDHFLFWSFVATGKKSVSILRSIDHLFQAGIFVLMGLFGGWVLVFNAASRATKALWLGWAIIFTIEAYTSGLGWHSNHLGPGIMLAACWLFPALVKVWPVRGQSRSWLEYQTRQSAAVVAVVMLWGALGLVRMPQNPIPADFFRYVNDIEKEFAGMATHKVLMDTGNWIYLREGVLMKDRSETVGIWVGKNQEIDFPYVAETIKRIENKSYDKILARQLDTDQSWYDFQDRGSGVKSAILANYEPIRRVPAVRGIGAWWPHHLVAEVLVLVPKSTK